MSTAIEQKKTQQVTTIKDLLDRQQAEFARALPRHLDIDRFMRIAFTSIRQNPKLLECTPHSLLASVMQAAQLGLEPDGILGHAYLVPYKNTRAGTSEAQFQVGYKGLISLARRSGEVRSICAQVVYSRDRFEFAYGLNEKLEHIPARADRGEPIAAYAVAQFKDGGHAFEVMFKEDIEKIRRKSRAADNGPWVDFPDEMWRKTAVRKLAKYLPLSVEFQRAAALDEYADLVGLEPVGQRGPDRTQEVMNRFTEPNKELPAEQKASCNKDINTCGHALGPDNGEWGCEFTGETCPYAKKEAV